MKKIFVMFFILLCSNCLFAYELDGTKWTVVEKINIAGIIEGVDQNIQGKELTFSSSGKIVFLKQESLIKKETIEFWTEKKLYNETRGSESRGITFQDINYTEDTLKVIYYKTFENNFSLGQFCFLISENKMISIYEGCYYLLEKNWK